MRKSLKVVALFIGSSIFIAVLTVFLGPYTYNLLSRPGHEFGTKDLPDPPDYGLRTHWAAWPDEENPADLLPEMIQSVPPHQRIASAFFVHPTTYGGREHWVQPMDHLETITDTDQGTISIQASAFNGCCRVYAPRYRQSNITGYQEESAAEAIFSVGFRDVKNSFFHFLRTIGPNEPFILASHSQGTFHLVRLVEEEIDGSPLVDRMIAAYAIGHALPAALIEEAFEQIELCERPDQTGCFISWDAHEAERKPSIWSNKDEQVLWNGYDYSGFGVGHRICVNPITWSTGNQWSDKGEHAGALRAWSKNPRKADNLGPLITKTVSVRCGTDKERNWLFVNDDRDDRTKYKGTFSFLLRNLHGQDYGLFWGNIRQNSIDRTKAWKYRNEN